MTDNAVYYFSGTGNSFAVARDLATGLHASLVEISGLLPFTNGVDRCPGPGKMFGVVFPLYDFRAPSLVEEFLDSIETVPEVYIFAVCTYGVSPGSSLKRVKKQLARRGINLSAGFAVPMPHNAVGSGRLGHHQDDRLFNCWMTKSKYIIEIVRNREQIDPETRSVAMALLRVRILRTIPSILRLLWRMVFNGAQSLSFVADSSCIGCATCEKICPMNNISLHDGRPNWGDACTSCLACLHWCPEGAVSFGGTMLDTELYTHPEVCIGDMVKR